MLTLLGCLMMPVRVGIATEGPASRAVLEAICRRRGVTCRVRSSQGKNKLFREFDKILKSIEHSRQPERLIVVPDLHPETDCVIDAEKWNEEIAGKFPDAKLCLAVWETEQWLLADLNACSQFLGVNFQTPLDDPVGGQKPSKRLDDAFHQAKGYRGAFDKRVDGPRIVELMDLDSAAAHSPSLDRFLRLVSEEN